MKIVRKIITTLIIIIVVLLLLLLSKPRNKEIKKFYNSFGVELSKDTKVIYSESVFGWFGDGEGLIIYEVSPREMKQIIEHNSILDWLSLPVSKVTYDKLYKKIGIDSQEIKQHLNLDNEQGSFTVIDRFGSSNTKLTIRENIDSFKFENFTLGIINIKENKIYLYEYNQ